MRANRCPEVESIEVRRSALPPGLVVVVALGVLAAPAVLGAQELPFFHLTPENQVTPLPSASVQKLLQDTQGFIWMGFYSTGLARFDGHAFETFGLEDGLADLTIRDLLQDGRQYLWVATEGGVVVSEKPLPAYGINERIRFTDCIGTTTLAKGRIRHSCLALHSSAGAWVGTIEGAVRYRWDGSGALEQQLFRPGPGKGGALAPASGILELPDGTMLLALLDGRLMRLPAGATALEELPSTDDAVLCLHRRGYGPVWAGFASGALGRFRQQGAPGVEIVSRALTERIVEIQERTDGAVWVVSLGDGLLLHEPALRRETHYTRRHGLLGETMWSILEDREGNTWFAQNGGVSRLRADFKAFGRLTGTSCADGAPTLPDPAAFCSLPPNSDVGLGSLLWVGSSGGLTALRKDGTTSTFSAADGLASKTVYGLGRDHESRIWVATVNGLNVLSTGDLPGPLDGFSERTVTMPPYRLRMGRYPIGLLYTCTPLRVPLSPGSAETAEVILAAGASGLAIWADERWFLLRAAAGLPVSGATCTASDTFGRIWCGTSDFGLQRSVEPWTMESFRRWERDGVSMSGREVVRRVFEPAWPGGGRVGAGILSMLASQGRLWVGTGAGLFAVEGEPPGVALQLDVQTGLGGSTIRGIAWAERWKTMWVSQGHGLAEIEPIHGLVRRLVTKNDGLVDNEAWAYSALEATLDGTLLFSTPKGLSLYRPDLDTRNEVPPLLAMRRAVVTEGGAGHNEVALEYAALSYTDENRVQFRTRMRGFDPDWSEPTTETKIRYTNLPAVGFPKTYVFEVMAANADGEWAPEPLRFPITIHPPWWLAWWSFLTIVALFAVAVLGFNHVRTSTLQERARELEAEVARRTEKVQAQTHELQSLERVLRQINQEVRLESVLQALLDQGMTLFPQAEKALFVSFDRASNSFQVKAVSGWDADIFAGYGLSLPEALRRYAEGAERVGEGVFIVRDFSGRPGTERLPDLPVPQAMLTMAVTIGERVEGFMAFDNFTDPQAFDNSDLRRLSLFRQHAISAIQKARTMRDLEEANRDALQASQAKSAFLANMSHELRTPLNSIIGFSEILISRAGPSLHPRLTKFLENINSSGQHLLGIINDVLDLSKIEAGKMELHLEQMDVPVAVEGVCVIMRPLAQKKGIHFQVEIPRDVPQIEVDIPRVKQVLYNLLSNAVKFSPEGSTVQVRARLVPATQSPIRVEAVALEVQDSGIGIAPEDQKRIFEEFVQADGSIRRQVGGTGLGLALVKRFVEMHGGIVCLASEPGRGSTFTVILPRRSNVGRTRNP